MSSLASHFSLAISGFEVNGSMIPQGPVNSAHPPAISSPHCEQSQQPLKLHRMTSSPWNAKLTHARRNLLPPRYAVYFRMEDQTNLRSCARLLIRPSSTFAGPLSCFFCSVLVSDLKVALHILNRRENFVHPCGPRLRWRSPPPDATWPLRMNCGRISLSQHLDSSGTQYG